MRSGAISSASVRRVTRSSSSARSESAVATPSSSMKLPRPFTTSRWMRTLCHSSRWRSFSTTVEHAERGLQRRFQRLRVVDRGEPVARLARLVGVHAVVLDQRRAAGLLLAQLQPARVHAEVRVALAEDAAVVRSQADDDGQRALGVRVGRLELDVAARRCHRPDTSTFRGMDGVTVVDHVLLRRLLSILRDKDTPHRVFRETHDGRGADPRLRGDARAARRRRGDRDAAGAHARRAARGRGVRRSRSCARASAWWTASCGSCRRRAWGIWACTATRRPCGRSGTTRTSRPASRTPRCSSWTRCSPPAAAACRRSPA